MKEKSSRALSIFLWVFAIVLTVVVAIYQRRTGPTYPISVKEDFAGAPVTGSLQRSYDGKDGAKVTLKVADPNVTGQVLWRLYPTNDEWQTLPMTQSADSLDVELPHLPAAGKLEYRVLLSAGQASVALPKTHPAVLRYRGAVPAPVLIGHVVTIFLGLLYGLRIGLAGIFGEAKPWRLGLHLMITSVMGGFLLGPLMQQYAFGALWTGWPVGEDLTDTKTLLTVVVWGLAWWLAIKKPSFGRIAAVISLALMLGVYLIPHSVRGSEIDWSKRARPSASPSARP